MRRWIVLAAVAAIVGSAATTASADATWLAARSGSAESVRAVGGGTARTSTMGALVTLPSGTDPAPLGLIGLTSEHAALVGDAASIVRFASLHPTLGVSLAPPLRTKLDLEVPFVDASPRQLSLPLDGSGVYVGIVDTGVDVGHPDFLDESGHTRVVWLLDLSTKPRAGVALDQKYGARTWSHDELQAAIDAGSPLTPGDLDGHGSHVAGIAAGNGGPNKRYVGMAPKAGIVAVIASRDGSGAIYESDAALGVKFVFERATTDGKPAVANLSIGSQFGPHDDTSSFERALTALAADGGSGGKGRAIVAAASNEGSDPIHMAVHSSPSARAEVPVRLAGSDGKGRVYGNAQAYIWLTYRDGRVPSLGLRGPDGSTWIAPMAAGSAVEVHPVAGVTVVAVNEAIDSTRDDRIPAGSHGGIVVLDGPLPAGDYQLTIDGEATIDAWAQGGGDALQRPAYPYFPRGAQVDGTIGVPASSMGVIAAGCVGDRVTYTARSGTTYDVPNLLPLDESHSQPVFAHRCWFSSAGPSAAGNVRPDVLAPGLIVPSVLSRQVHVSALGTFDPTELVDGSHAVLAGTSMSSPFVAGAAALLFQRDTTLTQDGVRAALQAGARPVAGERSDPWSYGDGTGILDVRAALAALDRRGGTATSGATTTRIRVADRYVPLDGSRLEVVAVTQDDAGLPADATGFSVHVGGASMAGSVDHVGVGAYRFWIVAAPGIASSAIIDIGGSAPASVTLPVGADAWDATSGLTAAGGCGTSRTAARGWLFIAAITAGLRRSRSRSRAD